MHPFVHAFSPAIDPPWEARSDFEAFHLIARQLSDLARTHLGVRHDLVQRPAAARHPGRDRRSPVAWCVTGGAARSPPVPGKTMPALAVVERDYTAIADKLAAVGPLADSARLHHQERHLPARGGGRAARRQERRDARRRGRRSARRSTPTSSWPRRSSPSPARPTAQLAVQGFRTLEKRVGKPLADLAEGSEEKRITFADTQARPVPVITCPEWSGSRDRRTPLRAVHRQRRAAQAVAHPDRADALLPRPRLDARPRRAAADLPAAAGHAPALRRAHARRRTAASRSPCAT